MYVNESVKYEEAKLLNSVYTTHNRKCTDLPVRNGLKSPLTYRNT